MTSVYNKHKTYHNLEKIAKNKLKLIQDQIDLEKLEIHQNQTKMERLSSHNCNKKNYRGCRFWTEKSNDQFKNKNLNHVFNKRNFVKIQDKNKINQSTEKFYGLARNKKTKSQITAKDDNRLYQSKYAQIDSHKNENIEFKPTKMTTLVTKPKNENETIVSNSSDNESEATFQASDDVKFQRLDAMKKIIVDEKNKKRDRRMLSFMQRHLLKAQKEHKIKKNTTLKLIHTAKELRKKQSKFIQKKFKERQIEKYFKRSQQREKKIKYLEWIYEHNENMLLANRMKKDFLKYCDLLNTKSEPTIFFRPNMEENILQEVFKNEITSSNFRLQVALEKRLRILLETEGQCPTDPDSLDFKDSPYLSSYSNKK